MTARSEMVVVTLDGQVVGPGQPVLCPDDPMFVRGDGVFETVLVRARRPLLIEAHLRRLARSAMIAGLPAPNQDRLRAAASLATGRWTGSGDAVLRLVFGRARRGGVTGFVTASELPARVLDSRRDGVSAVTLDRGSGADAPWSLGGVKSLSYAFYAAAVAEAARRGADDAMLVSADGFVLEGPRSSVLIVDGDGTLVTPPTTSAILPGTTVHALFELARSRGQACASRPLRVADVVAAQGVWLLSSLVLAARVHTLDDRPMHVATGVADVAALVDEAVEHGS